MDLEELIEIRQQNNEVSWMMCDYLNENPRLITPELMAEVDPDGILSEEAVYLALFTGACGLDTSCDESDADCDQSNTDCDHCDANCHDDTIPGSTTKDNTTAVPGSTQENTGTTTAAATESTQGNVSSSTPTCNVAPPTSTPSHRRALELETLYFRKSIKKLDPARYLNNPFYANIHIPEQARFGNWELKYQEYTPYEAFIRDDIMLEPDLREIPRIGFFSEKFRFPSVMENGHEWMSIKPSELETLEYSLHAIHGKVITFGLGLGYYTYMASQKEDVSEITVVERDTQVIALFEKYIFPQFTHPEKVHIITADAFQYAAETMPSQHFDYAMVDIWHDTSDGFEPYLKFKKLEYLSPSTIFHYWVEESLLSAYRWQMFDLLTSTATSPEHARHCLSDAFLRKLAATRITNQPLR